MFTDPEAKMSTKQNVLIAVALAVGLTTGIASAEPDVGAPVGPTCPGGYCGPYKAPEIDAAAGVQAIALLSAILLLVGERARRRKG
jgi:hypothetical protein